MNGCPAQTGPSGLRECDHAVMPSEQFVEHTRFDATTPATGSILCDFGVIGSADRNGSRRNHKAYDPGHRRQQGTGQFDTHRQRNALERMHR